MKKKVYTRTDGKTDVIMGAIGFILAFYISFSLIQEEWLFIGERIREVHFTTVLATFIFIIAGVVGLRRGMKILKVLDEKGINSITEDELRRF